MTFENKSLLREALRDLKMGLGLMKEYDFKTAHIRFIQADVKFGKLATLEKMNVIEEDDE